MTKLKLWQKKTTKKMEKKNSKTQTMTKLKNSNVKKSKTQIVTKKTVKKMWQIKNLNCDKNQKIQIVTVGLGTVVTAVVIVILIVASTTWHLNNR